MFIIKKGTQIKDDVFLTMLVTMLVYKPIGIDIINDFDFNKSSVSPTLGFRFGYKLF